MKIIGELQDYRNETDVSTMPNIQARRKKCTGPGDSLEYQNTPCIVGKLPLGWSKRVFSFSLNISCNRYRRGWKEVVCQSIKWQQVTKVAHLKSVKSEGIVKSKHLQRFLAAPLFSLPLPDFSYLLTESFTDSLNRSTGSATSLLCDLQCVS